MVLTSTFVWFVAIGAFLCGFAFGAISLGMLMHTAPLSDNPPLDDDGQDLL
jgi:hypothetical protein